ncbi:MULTISPECIES: hypothetical protein [Halorussus]|uniref:hypothetical protein n=1 Tax=Halorussus TaxID=1070314 RepID=UPI0020A21673|nr:hypothetical protein [Halorussus vallis]USZ78714.1 hypothetical protein NGM07_24700 [Halorussus vallis]
MGIVGTLKTSIVKVVAGLLGFGVLMAGGREVTFGSEPVGTVMVLIGIVLLVFAAKL